MQVFNQIDKLGDSCFHESLVSSLNQEYLCKILNETCLVHFRVRNGGSRDFL